jgi:CRISPR-associated protein Cas2
MNRSPGRIELFFLVCFDIVDDRKRYRVVKILKEYGCRVQKSVFECSRISEEQFLKMKHRIEERIDHGADTVRYYFICRQCLGKMEYSGIGELPTMLKYKVV